MQHKIHANQPTKHETSAALAQLSGHTSDHQQDNEANASRLVTH